MREDFLLENCLGYFKTKFLELKFDDEENMDEHDFNDEFESLLPDTIL